MKKSLSKIIARSLALLFLLNACSGAPVTQILPVEPATPTHPAVPTSTQIPAPMLLGTYDLLSPEDMRFDLDELFHRIETTHPDPYAKRPKGEVDLQRQLMYEELGQPMTLVEFYKRVAPLVNSLGDVHTQVFLPDDVSEVLYKKELFFPFVVATERGHAYIASNLSNHSGIEVDSELLEVNGTPVSILSEEANGLFPFGEVLHPHVFLFHFGSIPEYQLDVILPGQTAPVRFTVPSMASEQIRQKETADQSSNPRPSEPVVYETLPDQKTGILTVNSFEGIGALLKPAFVQIQEDGVQYLILDIRSNGGGRFDDVDALMDYLTDQPYSWCSKSYAAPFGGYGSGSPRETECEVIQPFDAAERFEGQLYLLVGPDTLSAAITFATILQDHGLATLSGEPTGDSASYCANVPDLSPLPRTRLLHRISRTCYIRPSGVADELPVIPDILIETTLADRLAGQDPVMKNTLEMIRHSN